MARRQSRPLAGAMVSSPHRPKAIYADGANDNGEGKRTGEMVAPLAGELGIRETTPSRRGPALPAHVINEERIVTTEIHALRAILNRRGTPSPGRVVTLPVKPQVDIADVGELTCP